MKLRGVKGHTTSPENTQGFFPFIVHSHLPLKLLLLAHRLVPHPHTGTSSRLAARWWCHPLNHYQIGAWLELDLKENCHTHGTSRYFLLVIVHLKGPEAIQNTYVRALCTSHHKLPIKPHGYNAQRHVIDREKKAYDHSKYIIITVLWEHVKQHLDAWGQLINFNINCRVIYSNERHVLLSLACHLLSRNPSQDACRIIGKWSC